MKARYSEIDEVIAYIHRHLYEPLSLARLAKQIAYSPYHFTRIFKEQTGLSPVYYVSALRLQKAKDLLLHTQLSIRDIGLEIGQQSLGTFTTRFTERVGVTPAQFRNSQQEAEHLFHSLQQMSNWNDPASSYFPFPKDTAVIQGTVHSAVPFEGVILIGLFPKPIPEGLPIHGTLLRSLGEFCFTNVQPGTYYLMATSVAWGMQALDFLLPTQTLRTRSKEPIIVQPFSSVPHQQVVLHPPRIDDPPIMVSIPLLMNQFLTRTHGLDQKRNL